MNPRDMRTREEFGSYILLKKLFEDPMGETFRAGKSGKGGLEEVILLRVFNGQGVDPERLWAKLADRRIVQEALKSPNLGNGIDLGRVRNVPYVAYEYISGKPLSSLMAKAERERSPIPTDHALLLAERIALGLTVGYETRINDQRIHHGFLVPHLVMLGNEGDLRVLGFEAAPALRDVTRTSSLAGEFSRYLSPEAIAGQPTNKADDVYSLGAVLFELLTGRRATSGVGAGQLNGAVLASEGAAIPDEIAQLLRRSLAPQAERIPDVLAWHRALSKLMIDGQYNPTTFNLAFFMHNLFRDEIEQESKEIEKEKTLVGPSREILAPPSAAATQAMPAASPATPVFQRFDTVDEEPKSGGPNKALLGGLAALLLVGAGAGVYFGLMGGGKKVAPPAAAPVADATVTASADGAANPAANPTSPVISMTQEEVKAQLEQLVAERYAIAEKNMRAQYDDKIKALQTSLDQAQRSNSERVAVPSPAATAPTTTPAQQPPASSEPAPATTPAQPAAAPATEPATSTPEPVSAAPTTQPAAPAPAPNGGAARPQVRVGDLVEASTPGLVQPKVRSMMDPRYPPAARQLNKNGNTIAVRLRVLIDENGKVQKAELSGQDPGYGFADAAMSAARSARFDPATLNGVRVKTWSAMRVDFKP